MSIIHTSWYYARLYSTDVQLSSTYATSSTHSRQTEMRVHYRILHRITSYCSMFLRVDLSVCYRDIFVAQIGLNNDNNKNNGSNNSSSNNNNSDIHAACPCPCPREFV